MHAHRADFHETTSVSTDRPWIEPTTAHIDLLPTLIDLLELRQPKEINFDGMSLVPLLQGNATDCSERTLFVHHQGRFGQKIQDDRRIKYKDFAEELDLAIDGALPPTVLDPQKHAVSPKLHGPPTGVIRAKTARLKVGGFDRTEPVKIGDKCLSFQVSLPAGKAWKKVENMSDEFDRATLEPLKWQSEPVGNKTEFNTGLLH